MPRILTGMIVAVVATACIGLAGGAVAADDAPKAAQPPVETRQGPEPASADLKSQIDALFPSLRQLAGHTAQQRPMLVEVAENLPPRLRCELLAPSSRWARPPAELTASDKSVLAALTAPGGPAGGYIEVRWLELRQEVAAADLLERIMAKAGLTVLASRLEAVKAGQVAECLAARPLRGGNAYLLVRAAAVRSGKMLFIVRCQAEDYWFRKLAYPFAATIYSFRPLQPQTPELVGQWDKACLGQSICYAAPAGEPCEVSADGADGWDVAYVLTLAGQPSGLLRVSVRPARGLANPSLALHGIMRELKSYGFAYHQQEQTWPAEHAGLKAKGLMFMARLEQKGVAYQVAALALPLPRQVATVWLLSPAASQSPSAWIHNKRAFRIVADSLRPMGAPN